VVVNISNHNLGSKLYEKHLIFISSYDRHLCPSSVFSISNSMKFRMRTKQWYSIVIIALGIFSLELVTSASSANAPSKGLKQALIAEFIKLGYSTADLNEESRNPPFSFAEVDLNNDGKKEIIGMFRKRLPCSNRACTAYIITADRNRTNYQSIAQFGTSRNGLNIAVLKTRSHGWLDIAAPYYHYEEPRGEDWEIWRFNGKTYVSANQRLKTAPKRIVLSEKYPAFDLRSKED
jgi:hypothetical protein